MGSAMAVFLEESHSWCEHLITILQIIFNRCVEGNETAYLVCVFLVVPRDAHLSLTYSSALIQIL